MKKPLVILLLLSSIPALASPAVELGVLQYPILIPSDGYLSESGFPLAIRNLDVNFLPFVGISGTLQTYSIRGLAADGIPSKGPLIGPCFTLLGNACAKLMLPVEPVRMTIKGGGFAFYNLDPPVMTGNLDRGIAEAENWDAAISDLQLENEVGGGFVVGGSVALAIVPDASSLFVEVLYYDGQAPLRLKGSLTGGKRGGEVIRKKVDYSGNVDFSCVEIIIGMTLSFGGEFGQELGE